ncbi:MAG: BlaI/MecI/CopY family transcriptional regulator [Deltaproteobacteria bacterium]|nr:BlaI/MecI/CopY family transcriptional regulator [Nannocystaceae bacterium]
MDETAIQSTEWDLLEVLWELERATAPQVAEALAERRGWAYSTVKTMLDRMLKKGLVHGRRVGHVWEYSAAVPRVDAQRSAWRRFVETAFGGAMAPALRFVATDAKLTRKQRDALLTLLRDEEDNHG